MRMLHCVVQLPWWLRERVLQQWPRSGGARRRSPGASPGVKSDETTHPCLGGSLRARVVACLIRRRLFEGSARSSSYGLHTCIRPPSGQHRIGHDSTLMAPGRCPGLREHRRSVGFDSPWGQPSCASSTSSHRRSRCASSLERTPALPSHAPCAHTDRCVRLSYSCRRHLPRPPPPPLLPPCLGVALTQP